MIRIAKINDAQEITNIYNYYVLNDVATFVEKPIHVKEIKYKIDNVLVFYIFVEDDKILGYAYAGKWNKRSAYRFSVEVSIYLIPEAIQKGIGTRLYTKLLNFLKLNNYHTVIGGISLPNKASIGLHEKFGFKKVAHYNEVGYKFNKWIDVGYWELKLENYQLK